jgi:hypothetical protein
MTSDISCDRPARPAGSPKGGAGRPDTIMGAFEEFLKDNPTMVDQPYAAAMAGTLTKASPVARMNLYRRLATRMIASE